MPAVHNTRKEAGEILLNYICEHNKGLEVGDDDYLAPFDFILEEVEREDRKKLVRTLCSALLKVDEALDESEAKTK